MTSSRYSFCDYSTEWPRQFEVEAARLRELQPGVLEEIHHIGSTSVPGLAAKPIIDLLPVVNGQSLLDALQEPLESAGYTGLGEYGLAGRRYFYRDVGGLRVCNVHCYAAGHPDIERHVALAAYLRAHADVAEEYAQLKRRVYEQHPADIEQYNAGKNDWIKRLEPIAIEWYRRANT